MAYRQAGLVAREDLVGNQLLTLFVCRGRVYDGCIGVDLQ